MKALTFVVLAAVVMTVLSQDEPFQCQPNISYKKQKKTFYYDLTPLFHDSTETDSLSKNYKGAEFVFMNPCGVSAAACWTPDSAVCLRTADWDYLSGGLLSTQKMSASNWKSAEVGKSVMITYSDGDSEKCEKDVKRSTDIHIICNPTATVPYFMEDFSDQNCKYAFYIYSSAGCGTQVKYQGPSDGGETFATVVLILFFVGLPLYFIIGFCLNKFLWKKEGSTLELLPNYAFWSSLPSLIVDGVKFIAHGFQKGDYVSV